MQNCRRLIPLAIGVIACAFTQCKPKDREIIQLPDGTSYTVTYQQMGDSIRIGKFDDGTIYYKSLKYKGLSGLTETENFTYYPNGAIRKYAFMVNDSLRYFRFFDKDGKVTEKGGCGLAYLDNDVLYTDTVPVNTPYFQQLRLVSPPFCKVRVLYGDEVEDEISRDMAKFPLQFLPIKGNYSGMLIKFDAPGTFNKVLYWSVEDTVHGGIEKGRVWRQFIAIEN